MTTRRVVSLVALALLCAPVSAQIGTITNTEAISGLKQALTDGSAAAVAKLGVKNGFFGNTRVKIPLPPSLKRVEGALRFAGMQRQADELVLSMNRAAEAAVIEAKPLLIDSVRNMSVQDAKGILTGGDTAATDYFRRTTQAQLTQRFLPVVKEATDRVGLAQQYNALAGQGAMFGLIEQDQATIEGYVTRKTLDGLYYMIGEQEKSFRRDPVGATSEIVRKVFGTLR